MWNMYKPNKKAHNTPYRVLGAIFALIPTALFYIALVLVLVRVIAWAVGV